MCAIFGAVAKKANLDLIDEVIFGLSRLQHRGEESAGVVYSDGKQVWIHKKYGLVSQIFTPDKIAEIKSRQPSMIIGQTHYSTSGNKTERNIPPQWIEPSRGRLGMVHNGNIPGLEQKKKELELASKGEVRFDYNSLEQMNDSEFMLKKVYWLISQNRWDIVEALLNFIQIIPGSYSAALLSQDGVYVFRDTYGNRPLLMVETENGIYFGSESCALQKFDQAKIRQVRPGEIIQVLPTGMIGSDIIVTAKNRHLAECIFEDIYFARPDSRTFGNQTGYSFRFRLGRELATLAPVYHADFVTYIPESGRPAAEGYAYQLGKPLISVYVRDHYIGRTFICPNPQVREMLAQMKLSLIPSSVKGKVVVLVDDTIVRGTVIGDRVKELKEIGQAKEVHVRISAPPTISPCYYGIDMKTKEELIAAKILTTDGIREKIDATSLAYLTLDSLNKVTEQSGYDPKNKCRGCFTGEYPIPLE